MSDFISITPEVDAVEKAFRVLFAAVKGVGLGAYRSVKSLVVTFVSTIVNEVKKEVNSL